ncbi:MAG: hypothetical protein OEZ20_01250 [candidate division WOR-3 bacterium]|nr:hypothetical protein [candidate division WOR-3 bacterium]
MAVGRFQVMATLQAARAYVSGMSVASAKSWGLNRAIFYAAAKKGFFKPKAGPPKPPEFKVPMPEEKLAAVRKSFGVTHLGDEMAYSVKLEGKTMFTIGSEIQTPENFKKSIEHRFSKSFSKAWQEAVQICKGYDKGVLQSQHYFYETVYKTRRDELAQKWTEMAAKPLSSPKRKTKR